MPETTLIPLVEKLVKLADDKDVIAKRRGELLRDIADWYEADEADYMLASLWKRVAKELADAEKES